MYEIKQKFDNSLLWVENEDLEGDILITIRLTSEEENVISTANIFLDQEQRRDLIKILQEMENKK